MSVQARSSATKEKAAANPLAALHHHGQAPWLDFLARKFIADGSLKTLVERACLARLETLEQAA